MDNNSSHNLSKTELLEENQRLKAELQAMRQASFAQKETESVFAHLIDQAIFPVVIVSIENDAILYANKNAYSYFGLKKETTTLKSADQFWVDSKCRQNFLQELRSKGQVDKFQAVLLTAQGKEKHVLLSSKTIEYQNKAAIYTVFSDITERVRVQTAYTQSENRYHSMYRMVNLMANTLPDLIWAKDLDDNYLFANSAIREKLLKCRPDETLIGKNDLFFAIRERNEGHRHTFGEICLNSDEIVKATRKKGRFLEDGLVRGQYLALDVHKAPMFDDNGELVGTVGAGRDVTADIKIQKALEESERRFRLLANNIRDVLWIADANLTPVYVTPSVEAFSGYTAEEFVRMPFISHMTPKYQRRFGGLFKRMLLAIDNREELSSSFFEFECKRKNGTIVWVEIATSAMWGPTGQLQGFTGMIRDSTKRVQEQLELKHAKKIAIAASQTKSEFLANMSHEIRTPMNGVLGLLQLLQGTELTPLQKKYVDTALGAGKSLLKIISDILDFSKIEAGKVECTKGVVSLRPLVASVMASFETMLDPRQVKLRCAIDPSIPDCIFACGPRLKQILFNLVGNAVKFTANGSIDLDISLVPRQDARQLLLKFSVKDTGIGITKNLQEQLFEPFSQEDGSFRRKYGGTGLGLSIVKNLVEMMGGKVHLESERGVGTVVSFTVLADVLEPELTAIDEEGVDATCPEIVSGEVAKVLVVEDEQINAMVISAMLKSLGLEVVHAADGVRAIEILKEKNFDCVLMDIQMPEMDGVETTREIRHSLENSNVAIPIVALTAHAMKGDREQFMAAGMNDYLSKPVEVEHLVEVLNRLKLNPLKN
ncbi:PAS domain S-box protein [Desulforhopalus sp. IMCC35007]|uniref:PAS domain S-box protein n=1 Tax=Desulforhopalus sp. IMCC35007 TaxID=2569543 RepID=UPI00145EFFAB|nr:PAS domain S-box protein [Desulforhopalus sp. IMCC35007]